MRYERIGKKQEMLAPVLDVLCLAHVCARLGAQEEK